MRKSRVTTRGSRAARCLEIVWGMLKNLYPTLPRVIIVILPARSRGALGHFSASAWRPPTGWNNSGAHEVAFHPSLFDNPIHLFTVVLHEAAHAMLYEAGVVDGGCSGSRGYYHRREFRDMCRKLGLRCEFYNGRYGWCLTSFDNDDVPARYESLVHVLRTGMPWGTSGRRWLVPKGRRTPESGHAPMICSCDPPRRIYGSKSEVIRGGIMCRFCSESFLSIKPEPEPE